MELGPTRTLVPKQEGLMTVPAPSPPYSPRKRLVSVSVAEEDC